MQLITIKGEVVTCLSFVCPFSLCSHRFLRVFRSFTCCIGFVLSSFAGAAYAQTVDDARIGGLAWLILNQNPNGNWGADGQPQVVITTQSLESFRKALINTSAYPYANGISWLANSNAYSTDSIARRVIELKAGGFEATVNAGIGYSDLWGILQDNRNEAYGWGAYSDYYTSYPDTSFALAAARVIGYTPFFQSNSWGLQNSVYCGLLYGQHTNGGWSYSGPAGGTSIVAEPAIGLTEILPTAYNILELKAISNTNVAASWSPGGVACTGTRTIATGIADGLAFILTKRNADGGFGLNGISTVAETAMAYKAISTLNSPANVNAVGALNYLLTQQDASLTDAKGSWSNDAYLTSLVLSVFPTPSVLLTDTDLDRIPNALELLLGRNPAVWDNKLVAPGGAPGGGATTAGLVITNTLSESTQRFARYTKVLTATGGVAPYSWSITSGSLPLGLTLNPVTGIISGNSSSKGVYDFDYAVTDAKMTRISVWGTITVISGPLEKAVFQLLDK